MQGSSIAFFPGISTFFHCCVQHILLVRVQCSIKTRILNLVDNTATCCSRVTPATKFVNVLFADIILVKFKQIIHHFFIDLAN